MALFRSTQSTATDTRTAVRELYEGIVQPDMALVMFFCSSAYDLELLASELNRLFQGVPVIGCTSAGNLGDIAYGKQALTGVSFPRSACTVATACHHDLQAFGAQQAQSMLDTLYKQLEQQGQEVVPASCFAWQLIDGMSKREEVVTRMLQGALGKIPLVGGSAGDDMHFKKTWVFCDGAFHSNSVALALVHTTLPFHIFMTQHFEPMQDRLVVTEADAPHRIVKELNGLPAAEEYARCLGVAADELNDLLFSDRPVVVTIGNGHYVRSIQRVLPDSQLCFYCAIEDGVVLRIARGVDLLGNLQQQFQQLRERLGTPSLILGCECTLRKVEVERLGLAEALQQLLAENRVIGFCSYGEQYRGVHINQTFTGIAIGEASPALQPQA